METLAPILSGAFFGLVAGLLPGINNTIVLTGLFFLLVQQDLTTICAFYISCLVVSQYMGSVTATLLGIPGESSSLPALTEGYAMHQNHQGHRALFVSAWGSLFGSLIAVSLALLSFPLVENLFLLSYTEVRITFMILLLIILISSSKNPYLLSIVLIVAGYALGQIGFNPFTAKTWGTFDNEYLAGGIPKMVVIIFFYALPMVLQNLKNIPGSVNLKTNSQSTLGSLPAASVLRGSIIGFFAGLIPNLTYVASTKFAWVVERWLQKKNYRVGDQKCLAAAETSNNSAVLTSLLPFLIFAIPIQLSEVVLLDIIRTTGQTFDINWFKNNLSTLILAFLAANLIGWCLALPAGRLTVSLFVRYNYLVIVLAIAMMFTGVFVSAAEIDQIGYYLSVALISFVIGWTLRKYDVTPLIFAMVLSSPVSLTLDIIQQKYF